MFFVSVIYVYIAATAVNNERISELVKNCFATYLAFGSFLAEPGLPQ